MVLSLGAVSTHHSPTPFQSDSNLLAFRINEVREWFRMYKTAEGKGENEYYKDGKVFDKVITTNVINEAHRQWREHRKPAEDYEEGEFEEIEGGDLDAQGRKEL